MNNTFQILFLLGLMRSGTTYFRNILSSNNSIQILGSEMNKFWTDIGDAPSGIVKDCLYLNKENLKIDTIKRVHNYYNKFYCKRNSLKSILYRYYRIKKYKNETLLKYGHPLYLLNKSTHLNNKVSYIDGIFPSAIYIYIIRDIYSYTNSLLKHFNNLINKNYIIKLPDNGSRSCWGFYKNNKKHEQFRFEDIPTYWINHNLLAIKSLKKLKDHRYIFVSYKNLVEEPDKVLSSIEELLNLNINRNFQQKLINNLTNEPLSDWEKDLSNNEKNIINKIISYNKNKFKEISNLVDIQ